MLIDIGANLTNRRFQQDLDEVLSRAQAAGVEHILVTGTSLAASQDALQLAHAHPKLLSCTAGVHPHDAKSWTADSEQVLRQLLTDPKVVAVGECGLDYNRDFSPREQQRHCFEAQLQLAQAVQKPVFLHQRDAHDDFIALLRDYRAKLSGVVVHCFTGSRAEMEEYIDLDCFIGITGWLCDARRGQDLRALLPYVPPGKLLIETDAPFLTPQNLPRKPKGNRNEPAFLPFVLSAAADLLALPQAELTAQLRANTYQLFGELG